MLAGVGKGVLWRPAAATWPAGRRHPCAHARAIVAAGDRSRVVGYGTFAFEEAP